MLHDVVSLRVIEPYRLEVAFDDGTVGCVDVASLVRFDGVFADLADPERFAEASVHPELRVVCWPNGADLDSDVLFAHVTGQPVQVGADRSAVR